MRSPTFKDRLDRATEEEGKAQEVLEREVLADDGVAPADFDDLEVLSAETCKLDCLPRRELRVAESCK